VNAEPLFKNAIGGKYAEKAGSGDEAKSGYLPRGKPAEEARGTSCFGNIRAKHTCVVRGFFMQGAGEKRSAAEEAT
jgi:hypothetical protein